jgi:hypothetical protein
MNRDEIIRMARNVEFPVGDCPDQLWEFAALVAAHEREACAKVCEDVAGAEAMDCAAAIRARR